jgi:hypothetical protein
MTEISPGINGSRDDRPAKYYARVPLAAARMPVLSHTARVLIVICSYTNARGQADPSHKTISTKTGLSRRDVQNAIAALKHSGVIEIQHQFRENGGKSSNRYVVVHLRDAGNARHEDAGNTRQGDAGNTRHGDVGNTRHGDAGNTQHEEDRSPEQKEPEQRVGRRERLREDWQPDDDGIQLAHSLGFEPTWLLEKFRDHHLSEGSQKADWNAAWRLWCRREVEHEDGGAPPSLMATNTQTTEIPRAQESPKREPFFSWRETVKHLRETGIWDRAWGPPPDHPDTKMPLNFRLQQPVKDWIAKNCAPKNRL